MALRSGKNYSGSTSHGSRAAIRYPTTPPPLGRDDIVEFDTRRRAANRSWQEALASRQRGKAREGLRFKQFSKRLGREMDKGSMAARAEMGGRGLAYSPMGLGKAFTEIRDTQADRLGEERAGMADRLAVLNEEVNRMRAGRDQEIAAIGADEARRRTELNRLIQMIGL